MAKQQEIKFNLSDEYVDVLAQVHGYNATKRIEKTNEDGTLEVKEEPNDQTKIDFIEDIIIRRLNDQVHEFHAQNHLRVMQSQLAEQSANNPGVTKAKKK